MSDKKEMPPLGGSKLDKSYRLLEDPLPPKGRVQTAIKHYYIAHSDINKLPQAVVKITSYLTGKKQAESHLFYIARCNENDDKQVELEDENGDVIQGREEIKDLVDEWRVDFSRKKVEELERLKIICHLGDDIDKEVLISQIRKQVKNDLSDFNTRVDKGRYETDLNNVYVTVKQKTFQDRMPIQEELEELFEKQFPELKFEVTRTKKYKERDTANIMFSTPQGSDPEKVKMAVRNTTNAYFGEKGFRYVFGLHTDTEKPHVHVCVKTFNERTGKKLIINPKDIQELRQLFVDKAKEQGIEMAASMTYERGLRKGGKSMKANKLEESFKSEGKDTDLLKRLKDEIKADVKSWDKEPVKKALLKYKQKLKTLDEYHLVIQELKNRSFKEPDKDKKAFLITLYKALEKESERLAESKIHRLNEKMRATYKEDANILQKAANEAKNEDQKRQFKFMSETLGQYADLMPLALSEKALKVIEIAKALETKNQEKDRGHEL